MAIPSPDCKFHEESLRRAVDALTTRANLTCTLYAENPDANGGPIQAHLISINYPTDYLQIDGPYDISDRMISWNQDMSMLVNVTSRRSFADNNQHWIQMRNNLRNGLDPRTDGAINAWRQMWQYYRLILTAASVARAVVFFYGTDWVRDLCVCELLRAKPSLNPLRELTSRWPLVQDLPQDIFDNCQHLPNGKYYITFLLLGVFLTEMARVGPIDVEPAMEDSTFNGDIRFRLPPYVLPPGVQNPLTPS